MTLTIAISYGGMWDMADAAKRIAQDVLDQKITVDQINVALFGQYIQS
jgi:undecaprenyl diphosphate synthase